MLLAWRQQHVMTYAGYIRFPTDTPETIARDTRINERNCRSTFLNFSI